LVRELRAAASPRECSYSRANIEPAKRADLVGLTVTVNWKIIDSDHVSQRAQELLSLGQQCGIVTNGYWATSPEDAEQWLHPMLDLGIVDFSVSDDEFHSTKGDQSPGAIAYRAASRLGFPCAKICIDPPTVVPVSDSGGGKGQPVTGGGVLFKGRAAEKLTAGLPVRPWRELTTCPHEELTNPERVHVDAYGNVHVCQGISIGNMWTTPLSELMRSYDAARHPIVGPLVEGGPARLVERFGLEVSDAYVDECHLCYTARKLLLPAFPQPLAPAQVYGL
jgi:hypothetical protein